MQTIELTVVAEGIAGLDQALPMAATVFLPEAPPPSCPAVFAFPGGGYSRRYFDLRIDDGTAYSQAQHHTDRGVVLVVIDHLCTGDSATPADPLAVTLEQLAEANAMAAGAITRRIETGSLGADGPPIRLSGAVGIGQSMGGCILTVQQGRWATFDAVAFLGWSGRHTAFPDPSGGTLPITVPARDDDLRAAPTPTMFTPEQFRFCFHYDDVPTEVVDADLGGGEGGDWRSSGAPPCAVTMLAPGVVAAEAAAITVPVLVACGERDVVPDPHAEPAAYPLSSDVTLTITPRMSHMHNFAGTREQLWDRLISWVNTVVPGVGLAG
jgi:pimeloyl-ACP methyl ester carboxylesterase